MEEFIVVTSLNEKATDEAKICIAKKMIKVVAPQREDPVDAVIIPLNKPVGKTLIHVLDGAQISCKESFEQVCIALGATFVEYLVPPDSLGTVKELQSP